MSITIQIIDVKIEDVPGKNYQRANVTYRTPDNKVEAKLVMSFVNPDVWAVLEKAQKDEWYDIDREKDKTGKYWNWVGIHRQDKPPVSGEPVAKVNTFAEKNALDKEKFEFEKEKQALIIRQSCISSAVAYMAAFGKGTTFTPSGVVQVAREFEDYVWGKGIAALTNDKID